MKKQLFSYLSIVLFSISCFSQFSKTHYIPPLSNTPNLSQTAENQYIYISCPSLTPINFKIKQIGSSDIIGTVSRDIPYVYSIGSGNGTQLLFDSSDVNTIKSNKGYIVEADDLVYVSVRLTSGNANQAGGIVSKGLAALGTEFRIGAFTNIDPPSTSNGIYYTFASILATENNTTISFSDIKTGTVLFNNAAAGNTPANVVLNAGQSFVIATNCLNFASRDGLIGAKITSDKPIAVNCGSFVGSNANTTNIDIGMDQIVSANRTGKEYIFIKGNGLNNIEKPLIVANTNGTQVFLNGSSTVFATLNAGQYLALDGSQFSANGSLYVNTSQNVFAYQGIGGSISQANQNMHFLPPLSCETPKVINNIPLINEVGSDNSYIATVNLVTETGGTLTFTINGTNYTYATLPATLIKSGPFPVLGNASYETYKIENVTGNISVYSTKPLYLSCFGSSGAATYGGYYSGFIYKPEITLAPINVASSNCLPNVQLAVNALFGYDVFQWFFNGVAISGATATTYNPTQPGFYYVKATLSSCGSTLTSDIIPVSSCANNSDNDLANDNVDLDSDNDGITNCTESYGDVVIDTSNSASGVVTVGTFSNSFSGVVSTSAVASATPFVGNSNGSFVIEVPAGKVNSATYKMTFAQPITIGMDYVSTAVAGDLLNSNAEFIVNSPINKTITVLNPGNQLLIDTDYNGIYESGVTQFSSFEIRFRLNSTTPLAAGTGTFKFISYLASTISITQKNLLDSALNRATFKFYAVCVPKDSDGDGITDNLDLDSDNDGITDAIEAQGATFVPFAGTDTNSDGIDNSYGNGITPIDSDTDGIPDYLDLDADNDGIFDLVESGSGAIDANFNGIIDGLPASFGTNGLANSLETVTDNGILNYIIANSDTDPKNNYIDLDSDNDLCNDVIEAGFADANNDGLLGTTAPPIVNSNGLVTSGVGYTTPNGNYIIGAPISISVQPIDKAACELQSASFTLTSTAVTTYQWQESTNGTTWTTISNGGISPMYSGATTATLTLSNIPNSINNYKYRVFLNKTGNSCGLISSGVSLTVYALPVITTPITLVQCDDDTDGISIFNLTQKNNFISSNFANENFTYYSTSAGASSGVGAIPNPLTYTSSNGTVYVRVQNANGCFRVAQLNLIVSVTTIPSTFNKTYSKCDDYVDPINNDRDGISTFDFSSANAAILATLPTGTIYNIKYYKNQADALAETDAAGASLAIANTSNYRNIGYPNIQSIWVRVDSTVLNACFGLGPFITLKVDKLPTVYPVNAANIIRNCSTNGSYAFTDSAAIQAAVLNGQTNVAVSYFTASGTPLPSPLPNPYNVTTTSETIKVRITNNTTIASEISYTPCYDEKTFQFIVDVLPNPALIPTSLTMVCDDESDPLLQNGTFNFDTSTFQTTILNGQTGLNVVYTDGAGLVLSSPLPNPFTTGTQNVTATITNPINTSCAVSIVIPFVVKPTPKIDLNTNGQANQIVCNVPSFNVLLDAGLTDGSSPSNYTYQWFLNSVAIPGATNYSLSVSAPGTYTVIIAFNAPNNCPKSRTIVVTLSDLASIQSFQIVELTDLNSVNVLVAQNGIGNYVFSLDDSYGPYQTSSFFSDLSIGVHTIFVKDLNGCGIASQQFYVLGAPKFFTPNGDGTNDFWNIKGIDPLKNSNSVIQIFDRYGKLIKQISPTGTGWDGTYNGSELPSDDYWYNVKFEDGRSTKGHFSLKR